MKLAEAEKICQDFANRHEVIFRREGEVGFGRPCCGILASNDSYVDYSPVKAIYRDVTALNPCDFQPLEEFSRVDLGPPDEIHHAYDKHRCLAVIHHWSEDQETENSQAIIELAKWILDMERKATEADGVLMINKYDNGYRGFQALLSGGHGYAIGVFDA